MEEKVNQTCTLISAKQLARMLSLSPRTVWRLRSSQSLPKPVSVGSSIRWKISDIKLFLECDCDIHKFEVMKGGSDA
jgi:predicted DNA-binding transcriptional regulator AlpA